MNLLKKLMIILKKLLLVLMLFFYSYEAIFTNITSSPIFVMSFHNTCVSASFTIVNIPLVDSIIRESIEPFSEMFMSIIEPIFFPSFMLIIFFDCKSDKRIISPLY